MKGSIFRVVMIEHPCEKRKLEADGYSLFGKAATSITQSMITTGNLEKHNYTEEFQDFINNLIDDPL